MEHTDQNTFRALNMISFKSFQFQISNLFFNIAIIQQNNLIFSWCWDRRSSNPSGSWQWLWCARNTLRIGVKTIQRMKTRVPLKYWPTFRTTCLSLVPDEIVLSEDEIIIPSRKLFSERWTEMKLTNDNKICFRFTRKI